MVVMPVDGVVVWRVCYGSPLCSPPDETEAVDMYRGRCCGRGGVDLGRLRLLAASVRCGSRLNCGSFGRISARRTASTTLHACTLLSVCPWQLHHAFWCLQLSCDSRDVPHIRSGSYRQRRAHMQATTSHEISYTQGIFPPLGPARGFCAALSIAGLPVLPSHPRMTASYTNAGRFHSRDIPTRQASTAPM